MTLWRMLGVATRRWLAVLVGLCATLGVTVWVGSLPGVYFGQVDVVLLRPVNHIVPNGLSMTDVSVIQTASVVQRAVSGGRESAHVVSPGVTLVDEGIRQGTSMRLPNAGGQWANNFDRALIRVDVVDLTPAAAQGRLDEAIRAITADLEARQTEAGAAPATWIRAELSPRQPAVVYRKGPVRRGQAMTLLVGGGLTAAALLLLEMHSDRGIRAPLPYRDRPGRGILKAGLERRREALE